MSTVSSSRGRSAGSGATDSPTRRADPDAAADALGGMVAKFAEMTLVQGYADFGFTRIVDQVTLLWANAIGLASDERP